MKSKWDQTPVSQQYDQTPIGQNLQTPVRNQNQGNMTPGQQADLDYRNRALTDEELNSMFPQEGYTIVLEPPTYVPIRTPARKLASTPVGNTDAGEFGFQDENGISTFLFFILNLF